MRAVVTGGFGFIGSNLVDRLIADGHEVLVIDNLSTGKAEYTNAKALLPFDPSKNRLVDVRDKASLLVAFMDFKPDVVFHLAALARIQPSIENPVEAHDVNLTGTLHVLEAARRCGAKRVVFSSSSSIYGGTIREGEGIDEDDIKRPESPYALQKLAGEDYCGLYAQLYGLETVCLRYFNVYGERQILSGAYAALIGIFLDQKAKGTPFTIVRPGTQRRDFTYVGDVVDANIRAATYEMADGEPKHDAFNIGTGKNWSVVEISDMVDRDHPKRFLEERKGECSETLADASHAEDILGWKPTTEIPDWIKKTLEITGAKTTGMENGAGAENKGVDTGAEEQAKVEETEEEKAKREADEAAAAEAAKAGGEGGEAGAAADQAAKGEGAGGEEKAA